jgi:SAM-dependent methyltransferase
MRRSSEIGDPPRGVSPVFWRLLTDERLSESTVLDVGTGTGRLALALAPLCRRVVGIDRAAESIAEAKRLAARARLDNVELVVGDVEADEYAPWRPDLVVAHLCMSDAIVARAGRVLAPGRALAFVAFHTDQWRETGRASRFAYDEERARRVLAETGFVVEHLEVEREVRTFGSVEEALAAVLGLGERWKADGRWFHYIRFLEEGGRTLTRSHLIVKARRAG